MILIPISTTSIIMYAQSMKMVIFHRACHNMFQKCKQPSTKWTHVAHLVITYVQHANKQGKQVWRRLLTKSRPAWCMLLKLGFRQPGVVEVLFTKWKLLSWCCYSLVKVLSKPPSTTSNNVTWRLPWSDAQTRRVSLRCVKI